MLADVPGIIWDRDDGDACNEGQAGGTGTNSDGHWPGRERSPQVMLTDLL